MCWDFPGHQRMVVDARGCHPQDAQTTWEGVCAVGATTEQGGIKLPWGECVTRGAEGLVQVLHMAQERKRGCKEDAPPSCPGPAPLMRGLRMPPPRCPLTTLILHTEPLSPAHFQRPPPKVLEPWPVPSFHQGGLQRVGWSCQAGGRRDLTLEASLLKQSKKQMALQSTGIASGWKSKMH